MRTFQPNHYTVLVKRIEPEKKQGSVYLPETSIKDSFEGKVIAVGKFVDDIRPDDHIFFEPYKGLPVSFDGNDYIVLRGEEILGHLCKS